MKRNKILFIIGLSFLLILVLGAAYAYFQINVNNNTTDSSVMGSTNKYGTVTLTTNTTKLYLKLTSDEMTEDKKGIIYYANSDSTGIPLTSDPNYILATASLIDGDLPLDCTYNFKVTATVKNAITDGSDEDVKITIGDTTKTLKELTGAGTNGVIISGTVNNLAARENKSLNLSSILLNTASNQTGLSGNSYTITISPYANGDTKAFSCKLHEKTLTEKLIASGKLWQSGLEGDGYRYVGTGEYQCSYNNGSYITTSGVNGCPNSTYDINQNKVTLDSNGQTKLSTAPDNFICFGTTSKSNCTSNQDKYMYRIIGVFRDSNGEEYVKLMKYKQLGIYQWNDANVDVNWEASTLYNGLNGNYFLTNTTYDYLQNNTWLNKIEDWTWSAVNTLTSSNSGPNYWDSVSSKEIYLHEMNRSAKANTVGNWTTPTGKIGLMYASDYALSLGSSALALTTGTYTNRALLKTGWMHQSNNDTTKSDYEWTLSRGGADYGYFYAWRVCSDGYVCGGNVDTTFGLRPVFYLDPNVKLNASAGDGNLNNPYILQ